MAKVGQDQVPETDVSPTGASPAPALDPRIVRTHESVMLAATALLVEGGPDALTMEAVVARSGVAKSTLYRHWETRDDLVRDVFLHCLPDLSVPEDADSFEDGFRALLDTLLRMLDDDKWAQLTPALLLLKRAHPELAEIDHDLRERQEVVFAGLLERGVTEGVLVPAVLDDIPRTVALAAGPLLFAGLTDAAPLDAALLDASAEQFLRAHRPDAPA